MTLESRPIRQRDIRFNLADSDLNRWHKGGFHISHYFNVQSLLFPQGERFFIRSVRHFREQIEDARLRDEIKGFISQEAIHGREHESYNEKLKEIGYRPDRFDKMLERNFRFLERYCSPVTCLAVTAGLEHITAITADSLLKNDPLFDGSDQQVTRLWRWHCLEESEHKSVAYDVYQRVAGGGPVSWLRRCATFFLASIGIQFCIWVMLLSVCARNGQLFNLSGWGSLAKVLWMRPGIFRREILHYFRYYRPGFHPWEIDNSRDLERWRGEFSQ